MSMNTKSVPSWYRYCMSRRSTLAVSTLIPALKVLSTTLPESTCLSLVRTKAGPLPGLTCWNSTTDHSCPSRLSTRPFFRSFVVATSVSTPAVATAGPGEKTVRGLQHQQFLGGNGEQLRAALGLRPDHQRVLDADAAPARQIDPGFDGDRSAIIQCTRQTGAQTRVLVDLQADAVAEAVAAELAEAGAGDDGARGGGHVRARHPRRQRLPAGLLRGEHQVVDLDLPVGPGPADHEGAGHVGMIALIHRPEVDLQELALADPPLPGPVVRHRRVRAGGHYGVEGPAVGAVVGHPALQLLRDVPLGAADQDRLGQLGQGPVGDGAR